MEHIWRWYCELGGARSSNGFGLNPLSYTDIKAWADLSGARPTPWEVRVLKRLDMVTLSQQRAKGSVSDDEEPEFTAEADDPEAVMGIFASLKARAAAVFGKG